MTAKIWHMNKDKNHKNVNNGSVITGNDKSVIEHSLGAKYINMLMTLHILLSTLTFRYICNSIDWDEYNIGCIVILGLFIAQ